MILVTAIQAAASTAGDGANAADVTSSIGFKDNLMLGVFAIFALLLMVETLRPNTKFSRHVAKASFLTNTSAFLFNNVILSLVSVSSLFIVAERYSHYGLLSGLDNGVIKWTATFVLFDFAVYIWHAALHRFEFLWRFHKIHHSDKSLNVTTGFRFHVIDQFLEVLYKCFVAVIIGAEAYTILVCEVLRMFFVLFHHANISFVGEKWLSYIIVTPTLHRAHHSTLRSEHDSNYGIALSIWDRIFGTRKELIPEKIGLDVVEAQNFVQLFCLAFITERRIVRLLQMLPRGKR